MAHRRHQRKKYGVNSTFSQSTSYHIHCIYSEAVPLKENSCKPWFSYIAILEQRTSIRNSSKASKLCRDDRPWASETQQSPWPHSPGCKVCAGNARIQGSRLYWGSRRPVSSKYQTIYNIRLSSAEVILTWLRTVVQCVTLMSLWHLECCVFICKDVEVGMTTSDLRIISSKMTSDVI